MLFSFLLAWLYHANLFLSESAATLETQSSIEFTCDKFNNTMVSIVQRIYRMEGNCTGHL